MRWKCTASAQIVCIVHQKYLRTKKKTKPFELQVKKNNKTKHYNNDLFVRILSICHLLYGYNYFVRGVCFIDGIFYFSRTRWSSVFLKEGRRKKKEKKKNSNNLVFLFRLAAGSLTDRNTHKKKGGLRCSSPTSSMTVVLFYDCSNHDHSQSGIYRIGRQGGGEYIKDWTERVNKILFAQLSKTCERFCDFEWVGGTL